MALRNTLMIKKEGIPTWVNGPQLESRIVVAIDGRPDRNAVSIEVRSGPTCEETVDSANPPSRDTVDTLEKAVWCCMVTESRQHLPVDTRESA